LEKFQVQDKGKLKGGDVTKWRENVPENVKYVDWEVFYDNKAIPSQKDL